MYSEKQYLHLVPPSPLVTPIIGFSASFASFFGFRQQPNDAKQILFFSIFILLLEFHGTRSLSVGICARKASVGDESSVGHEVVHVRKGVVGRRTGGAVERIAKRARLSPGFVVNCVGLVISKAGVHPTGLVEKSLVKLSFISS